MRANHRKGPGRLPAPKPTSATTVVDPRRCKRSRRRRSRSWRCQHQPNISNGPAGHQAFQDGPCASTSQRPCHGSLCRGIVEPMDAVQVAIRPPRALNQTQKRFRATRQKRRQPELPALEVNADGTFDFPSVRRLLASWEDFEPQVPVRKRLTQEWKPSLPEECVQRSNSQGADAHSRSGSRSGSRSNSRNDTPRDAEMKVEDVRSGVDSSMCSPLRMRLNSICDEAKSQFLVGGESCRPCNSPTNSPYGRASEAADEAGDDSDPFCMAVTVD